jgi:predicted RNase H-like nuclease (RuvC/YqgF family)
MESHGDRVLELHAKLDDLRAEVGHLRARNKDLEAMPQRVAELEQARADLEAGHAKLVRELDAAQRREEELARELAARTGELEAARVEGRPEPAPRPSAPVMPSDGDGTDEVPILTLEDVEADDVDVAEAPFEALMGELQSSAGLRGGGALSSPAQLPEAGDEDPDEREVTEIIDLEKL